MEAEEVINNDKYYEKDSYNVFDSFSIHGLNFEGIKRYYSIPINKKYHHMIKLNKDLDRIISNHLIEKEKREKLIKSNVYDDERLYKMYSGKKDENKTLTNDLYKNGKPKEKKFTNIKIVDNNTYNIFNNQIKINETNKNDIRQKLLKRENPLLTSNLINKKSNIIKTLSLPKNNNISYSIRKYKNKLEKNRTMNLNLPVIRPRRIIIEYQLTNNAGISKKNKNFGHNFFMGSNFNPQNYYVNSKNRTKRNVFGGLFIH